MTVYLAELERLLAKVRAAAKEFAANPLDTAVRARYAEAYDLLDEAASDALPALIEAVRALEETPCFYSDTPLGRDDCRRYPKPYPCRRCRALAAFTTTEETT